MLFAFELFVTLLLGGFVFHKYHKSSNLKRQYLEGNKYLFELIYMGLKLALPVIPVYVLIHHLASSFNFLIHLNSIAFSAGPEWWPSARRLLVFTPLVALHGAGWAWFLNRRIKGDAWKKAIIWDYGTEAQRILLKAQHNARTGNSQFALVEVTLEGGKVYVGIPPSTSLPDNQNNHDYILIIPHFSGHRSNSDQSVELTVDYRDFYKSENLTKDYTKQYSIALYMDKIISIRLFDIFAYGSHFNEPTERELLQKTLL